MTQTLDDWSTDFDSVAEMRDDESWSAHAGRRYSSLHPCSFSLASFLLVSQAMSVASLLASCDTMVLSGVGSQCGFRPAVHHGAHDYSSVFFSTLLLDFRISFTRRNDHLERCS